VAGEPTPRLLGGLLPATARAKRGALRIGVKSARMGLNRVGRYSGVAIDYVFAVLKDPAPHDPERPWRWELRSPADAIVLRSDTPFATQHECVADVEYTRDKLCAARIVVATP
jgi:hypothetical protein